MNESVDTTTHMGQLRSLLHAPTKSGWQEILSLLMDWPCEQALYDEALPYCHDFMKNWPKKVYRMPSADVMAALTGTLKAKARRALAIASLCQYLDWKGILQPRDIRAYDFELPPVQPKFWAEHLTFGLIAEHQIQLNYLLAHDMPHLTDVTLYNPESSLNKMGEQVGTASIDWSKLRGFELRGTGQAIYPFLERADLTQVRRLSTGHASQEIDLLLMHLLLEATSVKRLSTLDCSSSNLSEHAWFVIATHPNVRRLRRLDMDFNNLSDVILYTLLNAEALSKKARRDVHECILNEYPQFFEQFSIEAQAMS